MGWRTLQLQQHLSLDRNLGQHLAELLDVGPVRFEGMRIVSKQVLDSEDDPDQHLWAVVVEVQDLK